MPPDCFVHLVDRFLNVLIVVLALLIMILLDEQKN